MANEVGQETGRVLNDLANSVHKANAENGFYDLPESVLEQLKYDPLITDDERIFVEKAFTALRLGLINGEITEALEALRSNPSLPPKYSNEFLQGLLDNPDDAYFFEHFKSVVKDSFYDEIADAFIRILDLAGYE